ncbi:MAG TPA: 16S rRNA (uracil(1498)-N(3))-methyltransferase [Blastocatellia bacterium]|nr:16S rRNA (uracil(1498)-N(3))-methyltransferase [Blastocatellia bacterium]
MQRRRFYATPASIGESLIHLSSEESHHLARVLRLREGDEAFVFDGCGREYRCRVAQTDARVARLEIVEALADEVESPLDLTLAQALVKGEKFELIVQKATELGVRKIVPLITANADLKLSEERAEKRAERWRRIALEALKQSGGRRLVDIQSPLALADFITATQEQSAAPPVLLVFSEHGGAAVNEVLSNEDYARRVIALIGPEGGWDTGELDLLAASGARAVTLGPRILRTETAALAAVALIQHRLGDLSRELR